MHLNIDRPDLIAATAWAARFAATRSHIPSLTTTRLTVRDGVMRLAATDLMVTGQDAVAITGDGEAVACVPAKQLAQVAAAMPDGKVAVEFTGDQVTLAGRGVRFTLRALDAGDFPRIPGPVGPTTSGPSAEILDLIDRVAVAAYRDDARPVLQGVNLTIADGELAAVATDTYRLAAGRIPWESEEKATATVPTRALRELARLARLGDGTIAITLGEQQVALTTGDRTIVSQLIDAKFPDWEHLVPTVRAMTLTVDRAALLEAVKRLQIVASGKTIHPISLAIHGTEVVLRAGSGEFGAGEVTLPCDCDGELDIAFNAAYLLAAIETCLGETVEVALVDERKPAIVRAGGERNGALLHLLMPTLT